MTAVEHLKAKPIAASVVVGLLASLCCGGSLLFASLGVGGLYLSLGVFPFTPQALAAGAVSILAINYLYYRHVAKQETAGRAGVPLRQKMFISTAIGLTVMAGSFIFMEWLNHAVVHGDRFLARPEYGQAFIKGVPNTTLLYVCTTFFALAALWALPFPGRNSLHMKHEGLAGKPYALQSLEQRRSCSLVCFWTLRARYSDQRLSNIGAPTRSSRACNSVYQRRNPMTKLLASVALVLGVVASSTASAAEKTLTLAVQNMFCDACPLIVRKSPEAVPGVAK